jgi:uncharacterized protein (DUF4415 family)
MTVRKSGTAKRSKRIGSDMKKVDAYVLGPKDYEEIPELTDDDFARGVWHIGGKPVARGRPKADVTKDAVSLRLDRDVIAHFRRSGRGWQSRINAALRKVAKLPAAKTQKKA